MRVLPIFSMEEFDNIVKKYFVDPIPTPTPQPASSTKTSSSWW